MRAARVLVLASVVLLGACEDDRVRETKARLVGTWFAESEVQGTRVQRELTLAPDGAAKEITRTRTANGASASETREGEWFFDGVNVKRKYTFIDGKPLTNAYFIYETQTLQSVTDTELVGTSTVGAGTIRLVRVRPERTRP